MQYSLKKPQFFYLNYLLKTVDSVDFMTCIIKTFLFVILSNGNDQHFRHQAI